MVQKRKALIRAGIIGAGAAGCFCAAEIKRRLPSSEVYVFESGSRPLAKVAVTGGGRCNLTNSFEQIGNISEAYPRGAQLMKRALRLFDQHDVWKWFEKAGIPLVLQDDGCVFPASQNAMDIVHILERKMRDAGVKLLCRHKVKAVQKNSEGFNISFEDASLPSCNMDFVIVTAGGHPRMKGFSFLESFNLDYEEPVPSLFTFNIDDPGLKSLMGSVVNGASLSIPGTKFKAEGPLLITDWGLSGPAALKLSSYAARFLSEKSYSSPVKISWIGSANENYAFERVSKLSEENGKKMVANVFPSELSSRIWGHLIKRANLRSDLRWGEMGGKGMSRLAALLAGDIYNITGRCHFKGEFVTCGGVSLSNININTLESKKHPGLFFAGEVLDVDAITGGFNLQAAWSMGYIVAASICDDGFSC